MANITNLAFDESVTVRVFLKQGVSGSVPANFDAVNLDIQDHGLLVDYDAGSGDIRRIFVPWDNLIACDQNI